MALWLSEDLRAPSHLYNTIVVQLSAIRREFDERIPQVGIGFRPPWVPGMILLKVTDEAKELLRRGEYRDLDSLNSALELAEMDTSLLGAINVIDLTFEDHLHPERLSEMYERIPTVVRAAPNGYIGDSSNAYPWGQGSHITYLFREAWGDCPSGCIVSRYWYFECSGGDFSYVGYWGGSTPEPEWWEEAERGMREYRSHRP
jgi:hypothetical protein